MERRGFLGLLPLLPFALKSEKTEVKPESAINETTGSTFVLNDLEKVKVAKHIIIKGDDGKDYNVLCTETDNVKFKHLNFPNPLSGQITFKA